ncbi:unnamed protein product [Gongylonema pulchrum]|uniref:Large ribosomal subunit protein mL49 n=1 Tax=Gongylonema pulchrum TaxID=637853 RepID=A0A183DVV6_9BILA|nr:unnamed protein product [Gongylonema pulchrum]
MAVQKLDMKRRSERGMSSVLPATVSIKSDFSARKDLTFYVERKRDHLFPLYLETRRDQLDPKTLEYEYVELVVVKKIHGDIFACEKKIREYLEERLQHPVATHVDELKGFMRIKGADRALVEECLYYFGF